jgi:hypothetical protein
VPSRPSAPTSRSRRRLLALAAGGGLLATAGCLSALGSSGEANIDTGIGPDRLEYEGRFETEADALAETYGRHGVWGLADGPGVDGPTYVGAHRDSLSVPRDPDGGGEGDRGEDGPRWVTADGAAVVYRLSDAYRVWLWAGARARQPGTGLGRSSLTRLSVGAVAGDGWELVDFAPRGASREGPVSVSLDDRGPAGRTPLPGGGIGVDEGTRTGTNGRIGVAWQGIARGTRSVNAVCAFRSTGDGTDRPFAARVSVGVAGGRGAL